MPDSAMEKPEDKFGLERIVFFSDAMIVIAILLPVIDLKIPEIELRLGASELADQALET